MKEKRIIYKYPIKAKFGEQIVRMPKDSTILRADLDPNRQFSVWANVHEGVAESDFVGYRIFVYPTGKTLPDDAGMYLNTVIVAEKGLVLHVYTDQPY